MSQQAQVKTPDSPFNPHDSALWVLYQQAIVNGEMLADPHQARIIEALCPVFHALATRPPDAAAQSNEPGLFGRLLSLFDGDPQATVPDLISGVYIWGGVGRGKTFMVDFFYKHLPIEKKQRTHFHAFMKSVHDKLRALGHIEDPLEHVARQIANNTRILCLDEMHVNDITDAMLLGGLFKYLFDEGVTLVTTSNIAPAGLYKDGLQRKRFLPAIALLEAHTNVINSDGEMDYRMRVLERANVYQVGAGKDVTQALALYFTELVGADAEISHEPVEINTRPIPVRQRCKAVAWFDFDALCISSRSTLDYIELASRFSTVLIADIPVMGAMQDDAARRFVNLIDEFYDRRVNVVVSAAAAPDALYTGKRLAFEFQRTASRLMEMRTKEYLFTKHAQH